PLELLDLDMEMEAGLGIDSIKQVEILSELQARVPGMPEIEPAELANLRTLRDVADKLQPAGNGAATTKRPAAVDATVDTTALALEVVAEKTGYPLELLDLDMEMEAGLGIDSIKQVEILSELQARVPGMPEIEPAELANLRTLRDVADKLRPAAAVVIPTPPAPAAPAEVEGATDVTAFVPTFTAELRPGFGLAALQHDATVQVTNELPELARQIATGLRARGVPAEVVDEVSETSAVISLAGLAVADGTPDAETATAVHTRVMQAAGLVAQHSEPTERLLVTIQSTGGDFGLHADPGPAAWLGGLPGVVKTAAREWPGASLKAIDVEVPETAAAEILDELFCGGPALEVGISTARGRGVVRMEPLRRNDTDGPALAPGAVVVVSGGARGVTASSVARLAEAWNLRLALLGRSELGDWPDGVPLTTDAVQLTGALAAAAKRRGDAPDLADLQRQARALAAGAEVRQSLATLESRGIETLYLSADVADAAQLGRALDRVRDTWGPIAGIVHGAGVLRDKSIADLTPDRIREVFAPKVAGLAALLDATRDDPIELIALFSSIAARAGNAGQAAYAAANEVLNKVAATEAARRGPGCRVRSYNWGPWAGGMVDAALAAHFERQGIDLLSIEAGTDYFVADLGRGGDGVERVVLAAPSFPCGTHRLTVAANASSDSSAAREEQMEPAFVADLALRLGQALKPVHAMRAYLEDFVIGPLVPAAVAAAGGVAIVDVAPVDSGAPGYRMVFRDANGNAHSETLVRYSELGATPPPSQPSGDLEPWPIEASAAYETVLRREPGFQAIEALEGVSEEGGRALLRSGKSLGWPQRAFARGFDPAAFDGLLQLGALWTHHKAGAVQTMARMRSVVVHHLETIPERLRSAFSARRTATGTLFDFFLATEDGDLVAELRGVEFATPVA
ncbi:MAG: SDR family NAD(P)-dependent oxidoreductase, partial [Planctomycetota bacterium]